MTITDATFPPGPTGGVPDQLARFNADPYGYLEQLARDYGTLFTLSLGTLGNDEIPQVASNGKWVFLTRPHQLKVMYEAHHMEASGALANKVFFGTDEASVAYIDGPAHRRRRAQIHPALSGDDHYSNLVLEVLACSVAAWPRDTPFPLFVELQKVTAQVITEVVCGNMSTADRGQICDLLLRTENVRYTRQEVLDADKAIRAFIAQRIIGYLDAVARNRYDLFATLLKLREEGDDSLSHEVIRDEVFSLLYTGFSTTANTLSWAFVRILSDERVHRKLRQEIADVLGGRPPNRERIAGLAYLDATLKETLRLHPVTPLNGVRMLRQPIELDGYRIPAGTILVHCAYLLQRSPEIYPEPERFEPERFIDSDVDHYTWGAFGGGSRMCVGRSFSLWEMKMVLATMLSTYRIERVGAIPPARQQGFFMAPADGALMILRS